MPDSMTTGLLGSEAAKILKCHPENVRRLAREKMLLAHKVGRTWRLDPGSVARYARGHENQQLAIEWLVLGTDRDLRPRVDDLLRRTFNLSTDDVEEMLGIWEAKNVAS